MHRPPPIIALLCGVVSLLLVSAARAEVIWQIGKPDGSCREFAQAGRYEGWERLFPAASFRAGGEDSARWPWIQPGPADGWAGSRTHPLTLLFNLEGDPGPAYRLRVALVAVQAPVGARYRVEVNGKAGAFNLPPGPGDQVLTQLTTARPHVLNVPLPGSALRRGENRLTLTVVGGSWVVYDALSLETAAAVPAGRLTRIDVSPTHFLVRRDGGLKQLVDVTVPGAGLLSPSCEVIVGSTTARAKAEALSLGDVSMRVAVPAVEKPTPAVAVARVGNREIRRSFTLRPVRRWRIYIAPAAHLDIGYTHLQPQIQEIHSRNTDLAVDLCRKYPTFKWNLEGAWAAQHYLATRPPDRVAEFVRLAREGRINIEAGHSNLLTGLLSDEEFLRAYYYSHQLARRYGLKVKSATLTDVPSHVGTLPTVLAHCGIRYLSMGINQDRGPILDYGNLHLKSPVWWEGPDGSRVLAMFHPGYAHGGRFQGDPQAVADTVLGLVREYEGRKDYPYDAIHLHGAFSDNVAMNPALAEAVDAWNREYEYPRLMLSANYEFFEYMEKRYGSRIPVVKGCGSSYWEDGAGSSAQETALNRQSHAKAVTAESLLALRRLSGAADEYPAVRLANLWDDILLYDEHTWGAYNSISQPESDFVKGQWTIKAGFATRAAASADTLLREAGAQKGALAPTTRPAGAVLENRFYRLRLDSKTGAIASLYDKECRRELADPKARWRLGQVIYAEGSNNRAIHPDLSQPVPPFRFSAPTCSRVEAGPEGLVAHLEHPMFRSAQLVVSLPESEKRVDVRLEFDKKLTYDKEALYVAFPFQARRPAITYAVGDGYVRAGSEWLPGACKDWFSIQDWLRVNDGGDFDVVWSSPDAPLLQLQAINTGRWLKDLPITNGHVYSYALNNYWHTNYKAGQEGRFEFRYSLTSGRNLGNARAYRFGRHTANPLFDAVERAVELSSDSVALQAVKVAETGSGTVLRLRELGGTPVRTRVSLSDPRHPIRRAWLCNGLEEKLQELPVRKGAIEVPLRARGLATLLITTGG